MKTVTIDGQQFELVPYDTTRNDEKQVYALRPVAKPVENRELHTVSLTSNIDGHAHISVGYVLTENQAETLATAIQALVEYVRKDIIAPKEDIDLMVIADRARRAFQAGGDE